MEEEFSKQSELLSALAGIREKLEAVHLDVLAVKKQHDRSLKNSEHENR